MCGIGDEIYPGPQLPNCGIVLVNPRIGVSTPEVFKSLTRRDNPALPEFPDAFETLDALVRYIATCRNDLQAPAIKLCSEIGEIIAALEADDRIALARMSGSGATVFGLCETGDALDIERSLRERFPAWWIASGPLS